MSNGFSVVPVPGMPMVRPGDDLCAQILEALAANELALEDGDIVCLALNITETIRREAALTEARQKAEEQIAEFCS